MHIPCDSKSFVFIDSSQQILRPVPGQYLISVSIQNLSSLNHAQNYPPLSKPLHHYHSTSMEKESTLICFQFSAKHASSIDFHPHFNDAVFAQNLKKWTKMPLYSFFIMLSMCYSHAESSTENGNIYFGEIKNTTLNKLDMAQK